MDELTDPNNLSYWYPRIKDLVQTPETRIIHTDLDLLPLVDGEKVEGFKSFTLKLVMAGDEVGWPCFLRTGHGSGKHDWAATCHVPGPFQIPDHVRWLVEWSEMADFLGLPYQTWVVREMLKTDAAFYAFDGEMPITKERRYFAQDGVVLGFHPYWPPDAIEGHTEARGWQERLAVLNEMPDAEVLELCALSARVSRAVPGAWSIDWLWTTDRGWFLTDMAVAATSFCWREHPKAPKGEFGAHPRQVVMDEMFGQTTGEQ